MSEDLISRQAAVSHAISGLTREFEGEKWIRVSEVRESLKTMPSAQQEDWMGRNKERILQAGMKGQEVEFRIGGRLFAIREKAQ